MWIATRELQGVAYIERRLLDWRDTVGLPAKDAWHQELLIALAGDCRCNLSPCRCVDQATAELLKGLQSGALHSFGISAISDERVDLLPDDFAFARINYNSIEGLKLFRNFRLVTVRRIDVVALWPPLEVANDPAEYDPQTRIVSTAAAVKECKEWLLLQFADPVNAQVTRTELKDRAVLDAFKGRLSDRGFRIAWKAASEGFPSVRRPGPRRRQIVPPGSIRQ